MDWRRYVREHLPPLTVPAEREIEIVEELAGQLEATYARARSQGCDHEAALERAHQEVPDWQRLGAVLAGIERHGALGAATIDEREPRALWRSLAADFRHAVRAVTWWKGLPAATVLLGTSIAATLTVLAAFDTWLKPLPFAHGDRLALVWGTNREIGQVRDVVSGPTFADWRRESLTLEGLSAFAESDLTVQRDGHADVLGTLAVTPDFFRALGVTAAAGRLFEPADAGVPRVVISHELWQSDFGGDRHVVGRTLAPLGQPHEIIGVLPPGFRFLSAPDAVTLLEPRAMEKEPRTHYYYWVVGRLRDGVTFADGQRDLDVVMRRLSSQYPAMKGWTATVESVSATFGEPVRPSLFVLLATAGLVLLIGIGNTANLVISRAVARRREVAIRTALGATTGRVRRQWLIEGALVSLAGVTAGVAIAPVAVAAVSVIAPQSVAIAGSAATVELPPLALTSASLPFLAAAAIVIGLILGGLPLGSVTGADLRTGLATAPVQLTHGRRWLLAGQSAIATLLTAVAGLLLAMVLQLMATSPGFDPSGVTVLVIGGVHDLDAGARGRYYARVLDAVRANPGVISAALNDYVPLTNEDDYEGIEIPGRPRDGVGVPREEWRRISAGYFGAMGIPLLRGRAFTDADDDRAAPVVIINQSMANKYWPAVNPVGTRIRITSKAYGWSEIVGVVGDVREAGLDRPVKPMMFVPYHRDPRPVMGLFVKTTAQSESMTAVLRRAVWSVDATRPILGADVMERVVGDSFAMQRSVLWIAAVLAGLALMLIAGGTYAVVTLVSLGRRHEMAVRLALGAGTVDIARAVLARPFGFAAAGIVVGLSLAWPAARALEARVHGLGALDARTAGGSAAIVVLMIAGAGAMPLWRALATNPGSTLRSE